MALTEVITRRNLPHWFVPGAAHFVTYRLYGTLPQSALEELRSQKESLLKQQREAGSTLVQHRANIHKLLFRLYDDWLDNEPDMSWLAEPRIAAMIRSNLYHHHRSKYLLLAYCIMPNHVHVLLQPIEKVLTPISGVLPESAVGEQPDGTSPLSGIMHSLKSYTAHEANKILKRSGSFWQGESYDHWVRDEEELERIVNYIAHNPVKAGLVKEPYLWFFCSSHDRYLSDGDCAGWLYWEM